MINPDKIAEAAVNDLKDFLQRVWKMTSEMPRFDHLIEERIRELLASKELVSHQQDFYIAALNAARAERKWRRDCQEIEEQIKFRDEQDRHPDPTLADIG